ncbi:MAG: 23S rRNA (uracil(1939)-C(5))-methyltransferase RlmD [Legionellales bacterium]|nr:23S rRNA (uracil(1939)-C(5))-methyltransferase RlmD [Legionellales bacterium]|tara:strand:+ start:461 stop:1777 length:1317 start_codon:yes stop_codon:yes gene_type:complete
MFKTYHNILVTGVTHEGQGIAHINDRVCFIQGALLGERLDIQVIKKKKGSWFAVVTNVLSSSPKRIEPQCEVYDVCGGCGLQHMSTETQIDIKQQALIQQMQHQLGYIPEQVDDAIQLSPWAYRRKARLSVRYVAKKDSVLIGFRERSTHWVVNTKQCHILSKQVNQCLQRLAIILHGFSTRTVIAQVELAVADNVTCLVLRHLEALMAIEQEQLKAFARTEGIWLMTQSKKPYDLVKLWPEDHQYYLSYQLTTQGLTFDFHPADFIQVNGPVNQACVDKMLSWCALDGTERVLDLFCGLGNFTLPLAQQARWVDGYELSEEMVVRASSNAKKNNVSNVDFFATDLSAIQTGQWLMGHHYDLVVLDPPRCGAKEVVESIKSHIRPRRIVYISCHWPTMVRDCDLLADHYTVVKLVTMDMFPQTYHIEVMALLELRTND